MPRGELCKLVLSIAPRDATDLLLFSLLYFMIHESFPGHGVTTMIVIPITSLSSAFSIGRHFVLSLLSDDNTFGFLVSLGSSIAEKPSYAILMIL